MKKQKYFFYISVYKYSVYIIRLAEANKWSIYQVRLLEQRAFQIGLGQTSGIRSEYLNTSTVRVVFVRQRRTNGQRISKWI